MTSYRPNLFCTLINVDSILFNLINSQSIVAETQKEAFYNKMYVTMFSSLKNESDFSTYSSFKTAFFGFDDAPVDVEEVGDALLFAIGDHVHLGEGSPTVDDDEIEFLVVLC